MDYHNKYIKYKQKYLKLKNQQGGILPYVMQKDNTPDYYPFANTNFNYYNDDGYTLIINDEKDKIKEDYSLNKRFELVKLDSEKIDKSFYNNKNIINNNNIYKLADEQIDILSDKIPFHLCLLSQYFILEELYKKHIKNDIKYQFIFNKVKDNKKIFKLNKDIDTFLKDNAKDVITNIYNFHRERINEILNISYNYNILLKYSCCNKFLELLQLIYDIQTKIQTKIQTNISELYITSSSDYKQNIKILFEIDKFNLEEYIIINIINIFISSPDSKLKGNFDKILYFYNEKQRKKQQREQEPKQQSETESELLKDYENAIQTYINISDTILLFKQIRNKDKVGTIELIKQDIMEKINKDKKDLKKNYESLKEHLNIDIIDINQLLLFNLYVDNKIDISPKFSYIFYATFIYYRIKTPVISYNDIQNLYPINKNNFVCNLLNIDNEKLIFLINNIDDLSSPNKLMFDSTYIKHPIHSYGGFNISIEEINYTNCAENSILEFIKILFWDSTKKKFKINLPKEIDIDIDIEPLKKLDDILNDININLTEQSDQKNIESLYNSPDYKEKIHKLFSGHNKILYRKYSSKIVSNETPFANINNYEVASNKENFFEMLCIILNFKTIEKLNEYFLKIKEYNSDITKIEIISDTIDIYIQEKKLYTIHINIGHTKIESISNITILNLIKYDYFNLLINLNPNILSNYDDNNFKDYITEYKNKLSKNKDDKYFKLYKYLLQLIIIKSTHLTIYIDEECIDYNEIIITACYKNPFILNYIKESIIDLIFYELLKHIDQKHEYYTEIIIKIVRKRPKFIKEILIDSKDLLKILISVSSNSKIVSEIVNNIVEKYGTGYLSNILDEINENILLKYDLLINYDNIVTCIINKSPELILKIPTDSEFYYDIFFKSIDLDKDCKIANYLVKNNVIEIILDKINNDFYKLEHYKLNYQELIICILRKNPKLIKNIPTYLFNKDEYLEIITKSIFIEGEINYTLVDYFLQKRYDHRIIKDIFNKESNFFEILKKNISDSKINQDNLLKIIIIIFEDNDKIYNIVDDLVVNYPDFINKLLNTMTDQDNYEIFALYILNKHPQLIKYIPIDSEDKEIRSIILNSIDLKKDCIIIDYIIDKHPNYINYLLDNVRHKNYKHLLKYILNKNPKLIQKFKIYDTIIVAESIFVNNEINFALVDYLLNNNKEYINTVFENYRFNKEHEKYNDLVTYIDSKNPDLIKSIYRR